MATPEEIKAELAARKAKQDEAFQLPKSGGDNFLGDILLGAKKRAAGLGQLALEVTGNDDGEAYDVLQDLAAEYDRQGTGTGVSGAVGEIIGDPLTYALAPVAAANTVRGMAALGATGGAAAGATDPLKKGEDRATQVVVGTAGGALLAPAIGKGVQGLGRVAEKGVVNPARNLYNRASDWLKTNADDAIALEISGMNTADDIVRAANSLSKDAQAQFKQATKSGLNPKQAYLAAKFSEKGGIMTRAQAAQDPALQRLEDQAKMGVLGRDAYEIANNQEQLNKGALRNWAGELLSDVTGNPNAVVDETTTGDILSGALKSRYKELKKPAQDAYKAGMKSKARVAMDNLADFPAQIKQVLRDSDIYVEDTVNFKKDLGILERFTRKLPNEDKFALSSVKWPALEKMKQRMNSKAQWDVPLSTVSDFGKRQDIMAYRKMATEMTERQNDLLINGVLQNVDDAAAELSKAPKLYKEFRNAFGKKGAVTQIVENDLTDKQVADMLGSGVIGKGQTVNFIKEVKTALGDGAEESISQIRGTFLNRIFGRAYDKGDDAVFGQRVTSDLQKLKSQNKQLFDELFDDGQQQAITDFADVANQLSKSVRSKTNPSGSGVMNADNALNIMRRMGLSGNLLADAAQTVRGQLTTGADASAAIQSIVTPFKRAAADTRVISSTLRKGSNLTVPRAAGGFDTGVTVEEAIPVAPTLGSRPSADKIRKELQRRKSQQPITRSSPYLDKLARAESGKDGYNAQAKTSSAFGKYQMIKSTAYGLVDKYGAKHGITRKNWKTPRNQEILNGYFQRDNAAGLAKVLGRQPSEGEMYAAHFMGLGGAKRLLNPANGKKTAASVFKNAAKANKNIFYTKKGRARTFSEVAGVLEAKMGGDPMRPVREAQVFELARAIPDFKKLTPNQQQGLEVMSYHIGTKGVRNISGLRKALQSGDKNAIVSSIRNSKISKKVDFDTAKLAKMLTS